MQEQLTNFLQSGEQKVAASPFECTRGSDEKCTTMFKYVTTNTCCMSWTVDTENASPSVIEQGWIAQYKTMGLPTEKKDSTSYICVTNPGIITYDGKYTRIKDHSTGIIYKQYCDGAKVL